LRVEDYEGYEHPDEEFSGAAIPDWGKQVVAASCRGRSHAHVGKPRDDSYFYDVEDPSGWRFLAVADGAGSARFSRKGSDLACRTAVEEMKKFLSSDKFAEILSGKSEILAKWRAESAKGELAPEKQASFKQEFQIDKIVYNTVYQAYSNISKESIARREKSEDDKINIRDYHTTLLFMAIKKFDFGYFYISFWIGDGGMVIGLPDQKNDVRVLGAPDSGEYAGQTRFLTMREEIDEAKVAQRTFCGFAEDFGFIILASDGITDPYFPSEASVMAPENWLKFWNATLRTGDGENPGCPELFDDGMEPQDKAKALRKWLDFWSKGNHDDRTILVVRPVFQQTERLASEP
jgi:serine/threonine protein phosphatase PrpC